MNEPAPADPQYTPIPFGTFMAQLVAEVGFAAQRQGNRYTWEVPHYKAVLTHFEGDTIQLNLYVDRELLYGSSSLPMPDVVSHWSGEIIELVHGPQPPRRRPSKKYKADEKQIESWQGKMRRIQQQVYRLMDHRRWAQVYDAVVAANPDLSDANPMIRYLRSVYADFAVLAVRRQARPQTGSVALFGLIRDIEESATVITREWYRRLWHGKTTSRYQQLGMAGPFVDWAADDVFAEFADTQGDRVSPERVAADLWAMHHDTEAIVHFSDNVVAHDGEKGYRVDKYGMISKEDLDRAVLTVEYFTRRYSQLLLGTVPRNMTPLDLGNAASVLCLPWIQRDDVAAEIRHRFDPWNAET